jgi:hypothetical protein
MRSICFPNEADSVLIVDPDAMLSGPILLQGFKPVRWRNAKISELDRRFQLIELAQSSFRNTGPAPMIPSFKEQFGVSVFKALDHKIEL